MEQQKNTQTKERLEFRGGWAMAFLPVAIFLFFCILYFVVFKAFEMYAGHGSLCGASRGGHVCEKRTV